MDLGSPGEAQPSSSLVLSFPLAVRPGWRDGEAEGEGEGEEKVIRQREEQEGAWGAPRDTPRDLVVNLQQSGSRFIPAGF